ncbi:MAG: hypothetical protein L0287_37015 [Anaerolineae bacterium]|nr:hypothetical protein [Anaerolineae bacterium]MCI0690480.1 hypothetical protein [candidate division KSB1 bacterium]
MRISIACSMGDVTRVIFAFRTPNSHSNAAVASRFTIKNNGDRYSSPNHQFVNTS